METQMTEQWQESIRELIYLEGTLLDQRKWDEWLALFSPDVEYWVPSWKSDSELVTDRSQEVSIMWYPNRQGLEDRIYRIRTRKSPASDPLPRTVHLITCPVVRRTDDGDYLVTANFQVNSVRDQELSCYTGYYEYLIVKSSDSFLIRRKKTIIANDVLGVFDIYCI